MERVKLEKLVKLKKVASGDAINYISITDHYWPNKSGNWWTSYLIYLYVMLI